MTQSPTKGILVALASYAFYACSDAFIKSVGGQVTVFEIAFFITLFSCIPIFFGKPRDEKWSDALKIKNKRIVHLRGLSGLFGGLSAIYAFTHLELAEAYALIFLVPAFTTIISTIFLGEDVRWRRWFAVFLGFVGILIVLRPGFQEIQLAHFGGLSCAFFGAISITTVRSLSGQEKRITVLAMVFLYSLIFNGIAMLATFVLPTGEVLLHLLAGGILSGLGLTFMIHAISMIPANHIAPTQYSQMLWAIVLGMIFFAEIPDIYTLAGLVTIGLSGILIFLREEKRIGPRRRITLFRNR